MKTCDTSKHFGSTGRIVALLAGEGFFSSVCELVLLKILSYRSSCSCGVEGFFSLGCVFECVLRLEAVVQENLYCLQMKGLSQKGVRMWLFSVRAFVQE